MPFLFGDSLWPQSTGAGLGNLAQSGRQKLKTIEQAKQQDAFEQEVKTLPGYKPTGEGAPSSAPSILSQVNPLTPRTQVEQNAVTGLVMFPESTGAATAPLAQQVLAREKAEKQTALYKMQVKERAERLRRRTDRATNAVGKPEDPAARSRRINEDRATKRQNRKKWLQRLVADYNARQGRQMRFEESSTAQVSPADKFWPDKFQTPSSLTKPTGKIKSWEGDRQQSQSLQSDVTITPEFLFTDTDKPTLAFDGTNLHWIGRPHGHKTYPGVSGRTGYQSPEYQGALNKGPIPEGIWKAKQNRYQNINDDTLIGRIKNSLGGGLWPGGEKAWGEHRVWLDPQTDTDTKGRTGFSIHGGAIAGSAGCIDLTKCMPDFASDFKAYGDDLELHVFYPAPKASKKK